MSKKILIIEDEQYLSDLYKIKFEQEGYEVILARDGEEGLALAQNQQPDLILLDLVLPKMDGYQVLERLKDDKRTKNIKVYILSNLGQTEEINQGFKHGADGYLIKSNLTPSQLVDKIKKIFKGKVVGIKKSSTTSVGRKKTGKEKNKKLGKVLLVEDEEAIIDMYKLSLTKAGFEVKLARNGAWGLKLASQNDFNVIVMDMVMPAMDGRQALKKLKADVKTKDVPIIVLSNSAQDRDIEQAKKCGAASYLLKSQITPTRLVKEIKKVIEKNAKCKM